MTKTSATRAHRSLLAIGCIALSGFASTGPAIADDRTNLAVEDGRAAAGAEVALPDIAVGILQINAQSEIAARIADGVRVPAEYLGWEVIECDALGDPARMANCGSSLLNQGVDAVFSIAIEAGPIMAQLRDARDRGVIWITVGGGVTATDMMAAQYAPLETEMSDLLHDYLFAMLEQRPGEEKTLAISTFSQVWAGRQRSDALYRDIEGTDITVVHEHVSNLADQIADARQSVTYQLTAYPQVDALLGGADYTLPVMGQIVMQRFPGRAFPDRPLVVGYLDGMVNLNAIRQGGADALATMRLDACGWVGIDQVAQHVARGAQIDPNAYLDSTAVYGFDIREATLITRDNLPPEGAFWEPTYDFQSFFQAKWASEFGIGT